MAYCPNVTIEGTLSTPTYAVHSGAYMSGKHFPVDANPASAPSVPAAIVLGKTHVVTTAAIDSV